jgi:eukaryotic-like serine/threonine-protein kinase
VTSEIDAQSDLWAVGATLFTLASGQLVHDAANAQQLVIITATQPARSFATAFPNAPASIVEIIDRATAFKKSDRWATAAAMRDALKSVATGAFGALMTPMALGEIVDESPESKTTLIAAPLAASDPGAVATQPMGHTPARQVAYRGAPIAELATAGPVSSDARLRGGVTKKRPPIELLVVGGVGAFGIVCGIVAAIAVATRHPVANGGVASASASIAAASEPPASTPVAEPSGATAAPSDQQDSGVQEISVDQLPTASAAPRTTPAAPVAAKPAAVKTNCNPPYAFDAQGKKHFKRECL